MAPSSTLVPLTFTSQYRSAPPRGRPHGERREVHDCINAVGDEQCFERRHIALDQSPAAHASCSGRRQWA